MFIEDRRPDTLEEEDRHMIKHRRPGKHIPPHERASLMRSIQFDEKDLDLLKEIFGDEDTAMAVTEIIREAPPEIQILAVQLMNIIEEVA